MDSVLNNLDLTGLQKGVYSQGEWIASKGAFIDSINPTSEKVLGCVQSGTRQEIQTCIDQAAKAQKLWQQKPMPARGELMRQLGNIFRQHKTSLGTLISLEMGKSLREGEGEVQEMIDMADYVTGLSRVIGGQNFPSERPEHQLQEHWLPLGVVTVITAFNFPMAVWAWNALLGAMCGNTIIWKPSHKVPLCAIAVTKLVNSVMEQAGWPGVFSLAITQSHDVANALVEDRRIGLVSFTGSSHVGHQIQTQVATRLGRSLLELGGNNAVIVDKSASLNLAIPAIVFGAIGTAGQRCTTTRRVFIHKDIFDEVSNRLVKAYRQLKIGDPLDNKNHMGPLVDKDAVLLFEKTMDRVAQQKQKVLMGGRRLSTEGYFVEPTIVVGSKELDLMKEENFVPIVYLCPFDSIEEAIELNNSVDHGLSSSLFTNSLQRAHLFLSQQGSDCGIANINVGTSGAEIGAAFGGEKETGKGREAGSDAWKAYMRRQTVTINWGEQLPLSQGIKFDL